MCGIAGAICPLPLEPERIDRCLGLMGRRGPDGRQAYCHRSPWLGFVYLLHSRLRIIDLNARADQPLRAGPKVLSYNGELYNYLEVRQELAGRGVRFDTQSDTEVLLKTLVADGMAGLDRCEGMWAFAFLEEDRGTLWLARDRFGEKPLYVYREDGSLFFGSEIKFLAALRGRPFGVNATHLRRYLVNGYKALYKTRETFFAGVEEVPAGSYCAITPEGVGAYRGYWQPKLDGPQDEQMTFAEAVSGARDRLIRSVTLRLRADVPLAFCMSGGIDSNALISIAKQRLQYDVHGFTIMNSDARYEENDMVAASVRHLGIRHTPIPINTAGFLEGLRRLILQHDAPVYTISYYAHWLLMRSIAEHGYRVSISGTGADELFSGYYDHHLFYLASIRQLPELYGRSVAAWERHVKAIVRNPYLQRPSVFVDDPGLRDHIYLNAAEFAEYLQDPWGEPFAEEAYCRDPLRNRMLNELFHESVPVILHEDDLNAMYYSIENRSPFLDRGLFEYCLRIPSRHLVQAGRAKAVLREALRGIVADPILDNYRKVGFNAAIFSFLDVKNPAVVSQVLDDGPIFRYVKKDRIAALLGKPQIPNSESKFLFYFLCSRIFLDDFCR